jgi:hypothetical protein
LLNLRMAHWNARYALFVAFIQHFLTMTLKSFKFLNQEKEVALNLMVCFGIPLQGLWDWNFGILTSGYFLFSRCSLSGHIVWFSWWVSKFAMVAISPPTLCAETQWWKMKSQSSKTLNTVFEDHRGQSRSLRTWPNVSGAFC